jgi:hypothetical protein
MRVLEIKSDRSPGIKPIVEEEWCTTNAVIVGVVDRELTHS